MGYFLILRNYYIFHFWLIYLLIWQPTNTFDVQINKILFPIDFFKSLFFVLHNVFCIKVHSAHNGFLKF